MFSKVKKLFTVLAIVMMVSSSLPLNVLADESTSTKTENVTTTGGSEQTQTTSSTEGTKASTSDTTSTSEETTKPSNDGTSESQPNAPNSSNTGAEDKDAKGDEIPSEIKPEEKPTVTEDDLAKLQEELGKLGLQYRDGELANKDNTSSIKEPEVIQRALALLREYQAKVQGKANRLVKVGFSANATTVYVDRNTGYNNVHFTRKGETEWGWYMKRDSEGDPLWCIQPTVPLNWGANGGFSRSPETSDLYKKASLIAWFGYFKQPSVMNAFYTEMLIGETVEGSGPTAIWGGGYSLEGYSAFRNSVLNNVDTFFNKPTFASQTHTLKVGESITLTDTSGRLRNYTMYSSGGADVVRNGDSITITPNINTPDTTKIKFKFDIPLSYEGATLVYRQSGLQNVISAHVNDPTNFAITINTLKNGEGKLGKVDENGKPVPNAEFEVKNTATGETRTLTTNEHGEFNVTYPHGTVLEIHETKAPYGFYRDQETKTVTIQANQTVNVSFTNIHQKGKLTLTKEDVETGGTPQGDASLDNSVYALYKADGTFVQNIEFNDREGVADNLDLGDYYVQEVTAPKGYVLDTQKHNITIAYAGQDVKVSLTNSVVTDRVIKGSIKGWKFGNKSLIDKNVDLFNGNGNIKNPLEGVEITARSYTTGKEYKTVTDKNGYFEINNLPYDKYQLVESKGKEGYRLIMPFDFEIRTDGVVHQYLLEDKVIENKVKVVKQDAVTGKTIPIAHVQFKIFDTVKGAYISMLKPNSDESSEIFETNAEGYLVTSDTLLYGKDRYRLEEVQAPYRYTKGNPIFFSVDSKGNAETVVVNYKNVEQTSRVVLTKTVEKPVALEDKSSSLGAYKEFKFAQQGGQGFEFKIRAAEDIVKPEGTLVYHKGDFVKVTTEANGFIPNGAEEDYVLVTDGQGKVTSEPRLFVGKYELVEVKAPNGVVKANPIAFEVKYGGQDVKVTSSSVNVENRLQEVKISADKLQENIKSWNADLAVTDMENATNGQVFAIKVAEPLNANGVSVPQGTILGYSKVSNGVLSFDAIKLPNTTVKLYLEELNAGKDHVLDTTKHAFDYVPSNNDETQAIKVSNNGKAFENKLARANVELFKYDTAFHLYKENPVKDVEFKLYTKFNGKDVVLNTYKTDDNGKISVSNLPTGEYWFEEVSPLKGYKALESTLKFEVNPSVNGQTIKLKAENKRQPIEVGTQATFENGLKVLNPFKENELKDTIKFTNLMIGKSYIWKTKIVDADNPSNVIKEFDTPFVADKIDGEYVVRTTVDGSKLRGKRIVFLETLVDGEYPEYKWGEHNNPKDEGQTVRITNPQISTQATFENGLKEMNPFKESKLVDTVKFTDVTPNREYKLVTKLVEWGNPNNVIAEKTENFTPKSANGEYKVHLTVDGTKLRGKKVVFLEYLYDNEKPTEEQAKHENPKDEGQSVRFTNPQIGTKATFENGLKELNPFEENVIVDTIHYEDLVPNREYRVVTKLVEADITIGHDGKVLDDVTKELDNNVSVGTEVAKPKENNVTTVSEGTSTDSTSTETITETASVGTQTDKEVIYESETFFTPTEKSGDYKVTIKVDGTKLRGKTVVFYEYLYDNEKPNEEQAKHENPKDEGQSVRITNPKIGTQAHGYKGEDHKIVQPIKEMTLTDEIKYEDLTINREYRVVTKLIEFGNPDKVIKEVETTFTPKEKDGVYKLHLKLNGLELQGKKVTFLEYIYDAEKPKEELAKHENPKDEGQSVEIAKPTIKTLATGANGQKVIDGVGTQVVHEKAELKGLVVGQKYRVKVQAYIVGTTQPVEGTSAVKEFVADKETMEFNWDFNIKASQLGGKSISFTEILETENEGGGYEEVHRHNDDHKDKDQTVTIKTVIPKTGLERSAKVLLSVLILTFLATLLVVVSVKKRSQKRG